MSIIDFLLTGTYKDGFDGAQIIRIQIYLISVFLT